MKALFIITIFIFGSNLAKAQENWMSFPATSSDSARANQVQLNYNVKKGKMTLHQDARIDKLGEFVRSGETSVEGVKIKGYRIVIFFDQDKSVVAQQKANFLSRYNDHKAYIDYVAPNYLVRVGNFRTRLEAEALKAEILVYFPTAVVVADKIQLPELPTTDPLN